jgi:hypothetical protein
MAVTASANSRPVAIKWALLFDAGRRNIDPSPLSSMGSDPIRC